MCALSRGGGANFECCVYKQQQTNPTGYTFKLQCIEFSGLPYIFCALWSLNWAWTSLSRESEVPHGHQMSNVNTCSHLHYIWCIYWLRGNVKVYIIKNHQKYQYCLCECSTKMMDIQISVILFLDKIKIVAIVFFLRVVPVWVSSLAVTLTTLTFLSLSLSLSLFLCAGPGTGRDINGSACVSQSLWLLLACFACLFFKC